MTEILSRLADGLRLDVQAQCITQYVRHERAERRGTDDATLTNEALAQFETRWADLEGRLASVPGKDLFAKLNAFLMDGYDVSLSHGGVVRVFRADEIPSEMVDLVRRIDEFGEMPVGDA